ncbi:MAG: amylo-alpha-1,6-glucosidase [Verrucomicrobia bacterium]|nr:MAG: amylo-alpha-1,6-glucosidase [Verrucomicrobiota bacterium]
MKRQWQQSPAPGETMVRFVGDRVRFELRDPEGRARPPAWRAFLRTNIGRAAVLREEIITAVEEGRPPSLDSWRDIPLHWEEGVWRLELPLAEVGWFEAKTYALDSRGWQHWPDGPNVGLSVQPNTCRTANLIYCAFTRMFGPTKQARTTTPDPLEERMNELDRRGYTVIPASGTFRDLIRELPHIFDELGCRILHLLPIHPTPTTFARFGRFGSPYACLDLLAVDPALVEFDQRTTGLQQFGELVHAVHARGGRLFLDIVINHTGWGSKLWEDHPEWFQRNPDGTFKSPGAWGNVWGDLVELRHDLPELRRCIADALVEWCRRGVDGFRCDAGYMIPLDAWRYIIARVRREYPDTVFLLEGLGGSWEATERLLTKGNMQWAYSELFQNYTGPQVAWYLDYALDRSRHSGLYVHYSETHDNLRLAAKGRVWSLLRNRLCALTSVSGAFGFTCGVEWLATERVDVHASRGLAWGNPDNLVPELRKLNRLLADHPCFFDHARLRRLSPPDSPVYVLLRQAAETGDVVLVAVNTDPDHAHGVRIPPPDLANTPLAQAMERLGDWIELLDQAVPTMAWDPTAGLRIDLEPGAAVCLSPGPAAPAPRGEEYRLRRAREAFVLQALSRVAPVENLGGVDLAGLARRVGRDPEGFLATAARLASTPPEEQAQAAARLAPDPNLYPAVVPWSLADRHRLTPWPPRHWLMVEDDGPFRLRLEFPGQHALNIESVPAGGRHVAAVWNDGRDAGPAFLRLERYAGEPVRVEATLERLPAGPEEALRRAAAIRPTMVLLTNGRGGMARLPVDFGRVQSKYDCLLAANLHPAAPVDRHVFVKRARLWVNADGFISALDGSCLEDFQEGPPARWEFGAHAGDGRLVRIEVEAWMPPGRNATCLRFRRPATPPTGERTLPPEGDVRLTVRLDLEDRNFHHITLGTPEADQHFRTHTRRLEEAEGFAFHPAPERRLQAVCRGGRYHPEPEWCRAIPHPVEQSRGLEPLGDAWSPGWFEVPLPAGGEATLEVEAAEPAPPAEQPPLPLRDAPVVSKDDPWGQALARAARAFLVRRSPGWTVVAGYPWFLDWGRDTLICARGLLAAGWVDEVRDILRVFGRFEEAGTLPNAIFGEDASNRDTSDAPLWYGLVCAELADRTGDDLGRIEVAGGGRSLADVLRSIAAGYLKGTPNGIRVDPESALVWSPAHFTWMDTNHPAGTPREGYPVEIQALWIRLLEWLDRAGLPPVNEPWGALARHAREAFERLFWLDGRGWWADVLLAPKGRAAADAAPQDALRSNAVVPAALGLGRPEQSRRTLLAVRRWLLVPGALRSLAPLPVHPPLPIHGPDGRLLNDPERPYRGRYEGPEDTARKPAYHNGTAWTWTLPLFCEAMAKVWPEDGQALAAARSILAGMVPLWRAGCAGQFPEIMDGDAPHTQRGCDAQAWAATEALRVWLLLDRAGQPS